MGSWYGLVMRVRLGRAGPELPAGGSHAVYLGRCLTAVSREGGLPALVKGGPDCLQRIRLRLLNRGLTLFRALRFETQFDHEE